MSLFYLLSKFVGFFLAPAHWILLLIIAAFFIRRQPTKRYLLVAAFIIFIVFSNKALFNEAIISWQPSPKELTDSAGYSAAILLGGMSQADKNGRGFFTEASDRFIQAVQLYHRGVVKKVLITGASYSAEDADEADYLLPELVEAGVPAEDILVESNAKNTFENALFSKRILDSIGLRPPHIVVTSALHVPRSERVFQNAGMKVIMYPANYLAVDKPPKAADLLLPDINVLNNWRYLLKEVVGLLAYKITGKA